MKNRRGDAETRRHGEKPRDRVSTPPRRLSIRTTPVITLLTDFGTSDYFAGAMKGAILSVNPRAHIVDITHDIPAHDIEAAAFMLLAAYSSFPAGSIHVAVVDPGVGSSRRPILISAGGYFFIGPDNGIFSYAAGERAQTFEINNSKYFRSPVSSTFHGRDIFAPVAAALSKGVKPEQLGSKVDDWVRLPSLAIDGSNANKLEARIIHIDRFGNCVTNITRDDLDTSKSATLEINGVKVDSFRKFFADASSKKELFGIWGSAGFLEIAAENKSAAELLNARRGDRLVVRSLR